jgi:hypothetical protein
VCVRVEFVLFIILFYTRPSIDFKLSRACLILISVFLILKAGFNRITKGYALFMSNKQELLKYYNIRFTTLKIAFEFLKLCHYYILMKF